MLPRNEEGRTDYSGETGAAWFGEHWLSSIDVDWNQR
jgi:hypothetical protein